VDDLHVRPFRPALAFVLARHFVWAERRQFERCVVAVDSADEACTVVAVAKAYNVKADVVVDIAFVVASMTAWECEVSGCSRRCRQTPVVALKIEKLQFKTRL
jgi:hypothetical protein